MAFSSPLRSSSVSGAVASSSVASSLVSGIVAGRNELLCGFFILPLMVAHNLVNPQFAGDLDSVSWLMDAQAVEWFDHARVMEFVCHLCLCRLLRFVALFWQAARSGKSACLSKDENESVIGRLLNARLVVVVILCLFLFVSFEARARLVGAML